MVKVRQAKISDYQVMVSLAEEFLKTNNFAYLDVDIDIESVAKVVEKLTKEHIVLVLEVDNRIVGKIGGWIIPFIFDEKTKLFQEIFFYVKANFRKYSQLLLTELEKRCRELGLGRIIMGHPDSGELDKMERFYKARGYKKLEMHYIKRINK